MQPIHAIDFYKAGHRQQYPERTTLVFSNLTPRKSRLEGCEHMVWFGLQHFIRKWLIGRFQVGFFLHDKQTVLDAYKRRMDLGLGPNNIGTDHIAALHDYSRLPITIRALDEGVMCPIGVPALTMWNTHPEFFWVTNYLETLMSAELWMPCTSATIAAKYRRILDKWCAKTGGDPAFVDWQGHDFSMRGMAGVEAAILSGMGHLLSFKGTDTVPAIDELEAYYGGENVGGSVAATEHSVMCMGGEDGEFETFKRLITEVYPTGIVSIVSDTWDLWKVLTDYMPRLKNEIMARDGKVVIRPDSGDPVDIICGPESVDHFSLKPEMDPFEKGVVELLWEKFGGTVNDKGYKQLDPRVGCIYGDSITPARAELICKRLSEKGFASTNVVLGIGSYTYQYNTRDTLGIAMKATYGEVNGVGRSIFKKPMTDNGTKNSARGLLSVVRDDIYGRLCLLQDCTRADVVSEANELKEVFVDGRLVRTTSLEEIRARLKAEQKLCYG